MTEGLVSRSLYNIRIPYFQHFAFMSSVFSCNAVIICIGSFRFPMQQNYVFDYKVEGLPTVLTYRL